MGREYPSVLYPTIVEGKVWARTLRLESLNGSELFLSAYAIPGLWKDDHFHLKNFGPVEINGKLYGVTHMQKQSSRGWLRVSPKCYHSWRFFKRQKQDDKGNWIPGSEFGIYFRSPFSWRWDIAGTMIDEVMRHWIWTKGYIGAHWD